MNNYGNTLGKYFKEKRITGKIPQREIATAAGVTPQFISKIESGDRSSIPLQVIVSYCEKCGVSKEELLAQLIKERTQWFETELAAELAIQEKKHA